MTAFVKQSSFTIFNLFAFVIFVLCITACGRQGVTSNATLQPTNTPKVPGGYLAKGSSYVLFIQYTKTKDTLAGEWNEASIAANGNGIEQIRLYQTSFSSSLTDAQFVLSINGNTYTSSLDGENVVIEFPQQDGTLAPTVLKPASVTEYNNAIIKLRNTIQQDNQNAANAQATANAIANASAAQATASAIGAQATANVYAITATVTTDEQNRLNYDFSNIGGTIQQLNADSVFTSLFKDYTDNLSQMQTDYQTEQTDAKGGCPNATQVYSDANQVYSDQNQTSSNDNQFLADKNSLPNDIQSVQDFVDKIKHHWSNLGNVSPGVTQNVVDTAVNNGNKAIQDAKSAVTLATTQIQGYDATSQTIVQQAKALSYSMKC